MFKHAESVEEAFVNEQLFKRHCANPDLVPMRRRVLTELSEEEKKNLITNNALYHMSREELIAYGLEYNLQVPSIYLADPGTYITLMISAYSIFADKMNTSLQFKPTLSSWSADLTAQERLQIIAAYNSNSASVPVAVAPGQNNSPVGTPGVSVGVVPGTPVPGVTPSPVGGQPVTGGRTNPQSDRPGKTGKKKLDMEEGAEEEKGSGAGAGAGAGAGGLFSPERITEIKKKKKEKEERERKQRDVERLRKKLGVL